MTKPLEWLLIDGDWEAETNHLSAAVRQANTPEAWTAEIQGRFHPGLHVIIEVCAAGGDWSNPDGFDTAEEAKEACESLAEAVFGMVVT